MKKSRFLSMTLTGVCCLVVVAEALSAPPTPDLAGWKHHVRPFLAEHCFSCHGAEKQKADLNLEEATGNILDLTEAGIWKEMVGVLNAGEMPPEKQPRPPAEDLVKAVEWISRELAKAEQLARARGPGLRLRRLTNQEYRNTVRDLIGHPFDPTLRFLDDTEEHGFDNVADNLGLSTLHLQQYLQAAERIVDKMLEVPAEPPPRHHWLIEPILATPTTPLVPSDGAWHDGLWGKNMTRIKPGKVKLPEKPLRWVDPGPPGITGLVRGNIEIPNGFQPYRMVDLSSGNPVVYDGFADIRAFGSKIGGPAPFKNRFGFRWFAHDEGRYRVTLHLDAFTTEGRPRTVQVMRYPGAEILGEYEIPHGVARRIRLDLYVDDAKYMLRTSGNRFWGLLLYFEDGIRPERIEIEGPLHEQWPPAYDFVRSMGGRADTVAKALRDFATRTWRRPLRPGEHKELVTRYKEQRTRTKNHREAFRVPLVSILSSPHFLCRVERRSKQPGPQRLSAHELASRLSYFLWRTMPDDALRAAADDGSLLKEKVLAAHVERMLAAPEIDTFCKTFPARWLGVEKVMTVDVDPRMFPGVRWGLRRDMLEETQQVFTEILRTESSCLQLIDSNWTFLNSRLARHYGLPGPKDDVMRRVTLPEDSERGGILAHGSILTLTSNGMRTLPITRGAFVLENILASPTPPPPANVTSLEEVKQPRPNATTRELLELHREDPTCINCHQKIDPIGFALERYDAVGRWRSHEHTLVKGKRVRTHPVDSMGQLPGGEPFDGLPGLKQILLDASDKFRRCLVKKMLVYALDRDVNFTDTSLIDHLVREMTEQGDTL
ncbi:MAG: DUF1592 domain-containing protein, partial [Verrucomicrobiota bacterium]